MSVAFLDATKTLLQSLLQGTFTGSWQPGVSFFIDSMVSSIALS